MIKQNDYNNTKFQVLAKIDAIIDGAERLKKNITQDNVHGLGESLQNTWQLYYLLGQLHLLGADLEKER